MEIGFAILNLLYTHPTQSNNNNMKKDKISKELVFKIGADPLIMIDNRWIDRLIGRDEVIHMIGSQMMYSKFMIWQ